jgi:hypothetical protein
MSATRPLAVGALRITEPATMATDFAIAAICVAFAFGLGRAAAGIATPRGLWALSFAFTAVAAVVGGIVHGFALHLGTTAKARLWKATQYTMGLTGLAMLAAAIVAFTGGAVPRWLLAVAVCKFIVYASVVARRDDYSLVVVDYGASMLGMAALAIGAWLRDGAPATPWLVVGVAVSAVAAVVQVRKIAPHPRFNHNDLYHVIQIGALYLFYLGGMRLGDR